MPELANEDRTISVIAKGGLWVPGVPDYIEILAAKALANSKKILLDKIEWTITSGCALAGNTFNADGANTLAIIGSSTKMLSSSKKPILKDDAGLCGGSFTLNVSPFTVTPCICDVKIAASGQIKALGL